MGLKRLIYLLVFLTIAPVHAEFGLERFELSGDYGFSYHTLEGQQKSNKSSGRLTSPLYPFWNGSLGLRVTQSWGIRFFTGVEFVRFDDPEGSQETKNEKKELLNYGVELLNKIGPLTRIGYFYMVQERPLYFNKSPGKFEVIKKQFNQAGFSWTLSQRRRLGFLWALGVRGFVLFPVEGGNISTETGLGGEAFARMGFVGFFGSSYQLKAFYQTARSPNSEVEFVNESLGFSGQISFTF